MNKIITNNIILLIEVLKRKHFKNFKDETISLKKVTMEILKKMQ